MFEYRGVKFHWLGHDCFKIKYGNTIYIDPFRIESDESADIIFITHEHFDHMSKEDIMRISSSNTSIVAPSICADGLSSINCQELILLHAGDNRHVSDIAIKAVPAYNTNKFREPGRLFHSKEDGRLGYLITLGDVRIYHAGDSDPIPEMEKLEVDVALLPVSGTYVMTPEEAARAVDQIKPKIAIPMHYGAIVGDEKNAETFKRMASCEVHILAKE